MAKIPNGILGGVSGKIGGVIGSSWKGINVVKTRPLSVANPNTVPQQTQRTKFKAVTQFASDILSDFVKPYWDRFAVKQSGFNAFVAANIDVFENGQISTPANLAISDGKMSADEIVSCVISGGGNSLTIDWEIVPQTKFKVGNDLADQIVTGREGKVKAVGVNNSTREELGATLNFIEPPVSGEVLYVYLVNRRTDGTVTSKTAFFEFTVP